MLPARHALWVPSREGHPGRVRGPEPLIQTDDDDLAGRFHPVPQRRPGHRNRVPECPTPYIRDHRKGGGSTPEPRSDSGQRLRPRDTCCGVARACLLPLRVDDVVRCPPRLPLTNAIGRGYAWPAMFTIHEMPNLSTHIPNASPQGATSRGRTT